MSSGYVMLIDLEICSGCHACSVSCKAEHLAPLGNFRHKVQTIEQGLFPRTARAFVPTLCQHCTDAPCLQSCGVGAIQRTEEGVVIIDSETCIGSGTCVEACPYGAIFMDPMINQAVKCDFCLDRVKAGEQPACVTTCPTDAIVFGREDDPGVIAQQNSGRYTRWNPDETKPRVWYKGLKSEWERHLGRINPIEEGE